MAAVLSESMDDCIFFLETIQQPTDLNGSQNGRNFRTIRSVGADPSRHGRLFQDGKTHRRQVSIPFDSSFGWRDPCRLSGVREDGGKERGFGQKKDALLLGDERAILKCLLRSLNLPLATLNFVRVNIEARWDDSFYWQRLAVSKRVLNP